MPESQTPPAAPGNDVATQFPVGCKVAYKGGKPRGEVKAHEPLGIRVDWQHHPAVGQSTTTSGHYKAADLTLVPTSRP